jgi:hypothetical protein
VISPAPDQPGSFGQQLAIINAYVGLPGQYKKRWPKSCWQTVRATVIEHARQPRPEDLLARGGRRG